MGKKVTRTYVLTVFPILGQIGWLDGGEKEKKEKKGKKHLLVREIAVGIHLLALHGRVLLILLIRVRIS